MLKKIINVFLTKVAVVVLSLIIVVLQARALGPEDRGLLAALLIIPQLMLTISEAGMRQATTYFIGKKLYPVFNILGTMKVFLLLSIIVGTALALAFQYLSFKNEIGLYIIVFSILSLPFSLVISSYRGVFLGIQKINDFTKTLWIPKVFQLVIVATLFLFGLLNLETSILILLLMYFINWLIGYGKLRDNNIEYKFQGFDKIILTKMIKMGIVYSVSLFFIELNYKIGIISSKQFATTFDTGNYAVANQLIELLWQIPAAISVVFFSKSSNIKKHDINWSITVAKTCRIQFFILSLLSIVAGLLSIWLIPLVFGNEYSLVSSIFVILIPGVIFMGVFKIINVDFAGRGKPYISLFFIPLFCGLNYFLCKILSASYGVHGIAISVSLVYVISSVLIVMVYSKYYNIKVLDFFIPRKADFKLLLSNKNLR